MPQVRQAKSRSILITFAPLPETPPPPTPQGGTQRTCLASYLESPTRLQVRGLLNEDELEAAKGSGYLRGVHVLVATPHNLATVRGMPEFETMFQDLKAVAVDEVDACFKVRRRHCHLSLTTIVVRAP